MIGFGVPPRLAAMVSRQEAHGRARIADTVGNVAAMAAELTVLDGDGRSRMFLSVPIETVPKELHARTEALSRAGEYRANENGAG